MKYLINETTGCYEFLGGKDKDGYGRVMLNGVRYKAHRLALLGVSNIKSDLLVCHKCDNPSCINTDHLYLGTAKQNSLDCKTRGRLKPHLKSNHNLSKGSKHARATLKELDVSLIRLLYHSCYNTVQELTIKFNTNYNIVNSIIKNRSWRLDEISY